LQLVVPNPLPKIEKKSLRPNRRNEIMVFGFSLDFHVLAPATKVFHKLPWFL